LRPVIATFAPFDASADAIASPMPRDPPVTIAAVDFRSAVEVDEV